MAMRSPFPDHRLVWRLNDEVRLELAGSCTPCSRLEQGLRLGGYNALQGHSDMTARLLVSGDIHVGDRMVLGTADGQRPSTRLDAPGSQF